MRSITETKTGRYLIYAFGEILLVVIGILIALAINNWNENQKAHEDELTLFKNALHDLEEELQVTQTQIRWFKHFQDVHFNIYYQTIDSIPIDPQQDYNSLIWTSIYRPLIQENFGNQVGSMSDDRIQVLFRDLIWREKLVSEAMLEWNDFKNKTMRPFFSKNGINNSQSTFGHARYEFMSLDDIALLKFNILSKHFGTQEFDQILYESRHKASWVIHCLSNLEAACKKLENALTAFIDGDEQGMSDIEPLESYY